jgi:ABC-type transport system involved in multi-copper enzyme maturation permease subunit
VILILSSLPLMILGFLLGGIMLSEIARAYLVLILAAGTFGLLSIACSSYFRRTSSALVVSYLVILPLALLCVALTRTNDTLVEDSAVLREFVSVAVLPPWCLAIWTVVAILVNRRLLHPPDVGSEGKEVVDEEEEMKYAIGVVIDRDLFPDKLFAPAKRTDLMPDGTNPVLDKELRSEIFSQGTLMLRVVIQVSMLLSIPLMAGLLFLRPDKAAYYVAYVLTFNIMVGPVFSAGSITQERERQTLALLLTTLLRPGKIVLAKLIAALRVSTVLTFLLTEQLLLAYVLLPELRRLYWTLFVFLAIIAVTCLATSTIGLLCSALSRRTSVALVLTYLTLLILFVGPVGVGWYLEAFSSITADRLATLTVSSPYSAALSIPMPPAGGHRTLEDKQDLPVMPSLPPVLGLKLPVWAAFLVVYPPFCVLLYGVTYLAFRWRWWRAGGAA